MHAAAFARPPSPSRPPADEKPCLALADTRAQTPNPKRVRMTTWSHVWLRLLPPARRLPPLQAGRRRVLRREAAGRVGQDHVSLTMRRSALKPSTSARAL
eukprot:6176014-Pleurochrysis_carterae.AAC.1